MTPTLEDVAKRAKVSTATVSRCLNTPEKVVEATRARVMEAVEALGYSPHFGARVMAAKRTNTIGAIIPTMENAIFAEGLQAFQETLSAAGYDLLLASSSYDPDQEAAQIRSLVARGADGLLLIGHERTAGIEGFLAQRGLPVIVAWAYDPGAVLPSVGFDNYAAMQTLAQEVLAQGHSRIGYITAPVGQNDRTRARMQAIRDAAAGVEVTVREAPYGIEAGAEAFAALMDTARPPTVIMCANDVQAVGALTQAREMGLRVPEDVSITGFDDMALSRVVQPALTTVRVPHNAMGRAAAEMLIGIVERGESPAPVCLETRMMRRASLAPPSS
ncbi:LacI family DNA-binding transcriptional regulator [uncultured Sulfitobacter sp.]|uniref:LacI family DNA-binding transcriptional regulator n=1 Tax=uncultured Sulfitobacter sp. TaxID=191468 RepID=UPI002637CBCB|nr:LacI family DNA-binding transcriptional regulator [uncultured Sulfitobacter sp.]